MVNGELALLLFRFYTEFRGKTKVKSPKDSSKAFLMLGLDSARPPHYKVFERSREAAFALNT